MTDETMTHPEDERVYLMLVGFESPLDGKSVFVDAFAELEVGGKMSSDDVAAARELIDSDFAIADQRTIQGISFRYRFNPHLTPILIRTAGDLSPDMMEILLRCKMEEGIDVLRNFLESAKVRL